MMGLLEDVGDGGLVSQAVDPCKRILLNSLQASLTPIIMAPVAWRDSTQSFRQKKAKDKNER